MLPVQAPVSALDADGVVVAVAGTLAFAAGALWCWFSLETLRESGREWWLGVSVTGMVIGLLGTGYAKLRSTRRKRAALVEQSGVDRDRVPDWKR